MTHRYRNPNPAHRPHRAAAILRWGVWDPLRGRRRSLPPGMPAPRVEPNLELIHGGSSRPRVTWIGHASFLCQVDCQTILIDPVFSSRVGWVYRRHGRAGLRPDQLPSLAAVLVTHNHYDHLDLPSLKALPEDVPVVVPEGLGRYLRRRLRQPLVELEWWESTTLGEARVTLVPARHWSRRRILDTNHTLWGGFVLEMGGVALYHAGDTAWFEGFEEIRHRFPVLAAAMLPIGGYEPAWFMEHHHLNPEQAVDAFEVLGARCLIPMHWGAFQLTDEALRDPAERLRTRWTRIRSQDHRRLVMPAVGETVLLEN